MALRLLVTAADFDCDSSPPTAEYCTDDSSVAYRDCDCFSRRGLVSARLEMHADPYRYSHRFRCIDRTASYS